MPAWPTCLPTQIPRPRSSNAAWTAVRPGKIFHSTAGRRTHWQWMLKILPPYTPQNTPACSISGWRGILQQFYDFGFQVTAPAPGRIYLLAGRQPTIVHTVVPMISRVAWTAARPGSASRFHAVSIIQNACLSIQ